MVHDMGSASYVAYHGPHIFEFPLVRSEGAINIPSELKDYVFNAEYYSAKYPDLARLYGNDARKLYYHFINYGIEEGRSASPFFDVKYYAENGYKRGETASVTFLCDDGNMTYHYFCNVTQPVAPTCTTEGKTIGTQCITCGLVLEEPKSVPATGHNFANGACACGYSKNEDHSYTAYGVTREPTVSAVGELTGTCSLCSGTATVTIPKLNTTDYTKSTIIAPTCTDHGEDRYERKEPGYGSFSFTATTKALGHLVQTIPGREPTCTSSGMSDGAFCTRCEETLKAQEVLPRLGHDHVYVNMGQNHEIRCSRCTKVSTAAHSFENSTCICGKTEVTDPVLDASIKLSHSLNLASVISISFAVPTALLKGYDMSTVYLEYAVEYYDGDFYVGTETMRIDSVEVGSYYYFTLTGMTAVKMNDMVYSVLYGEKDGQVYYSAENRYSIRDYAYAKLNKNSASDRVKTLCADLLRYGAKAQIYKNYRTNALVDAVMTATHRAYLSDIEAVTFGNVDENLKDLPNAPIVWEVKALNLNSKVFFKYISSLGTYTGKVEKLTLKVKYVNYNGQPADATLANPELYSKVHEFYAFTFDVLLAAELRSVTEVAVYHGDTRLSHTFCYSPDTYGNNKTGNLLELCKALFAYSDSAKQYFVG